MYLPSYLHVVALKAQKDMSGTFKQWLNVIGTFRRTKITGNKASLD